MHIITEKVNGTEETNSEFFTPTHVLSGAGPSSNVGESQDSMDVYHDARSLNNSSISLNQRRRHSSNPANSHVQNGISNEVLQNLGTSSPLPTKPRVRHASYSMANPPTPKNISRLSFSTNSIRRNVNESLNDSLSNGTNCQSNGAVNSNYNSPFKLPPPPSKSSLKINSLPHQELEDHPSQVFRKTLSPVIESKDNPDATELIKSSPSTWMRNYVMCVETQDVIKEETVHFCDDEEYSENAKLHTNNPDEERTIVEMYSFDPVKNQRAPSFSNVRKECTPFYMKLEHNAPHLFVMSQWQNPQRLSCLYLGYRLFWGLYFLMWGFWSWHGSMGYDASLRIKSFYFTYMTNWGLWTLIFDTNLQIINTILHFRKMAYEGDPRYMKMKMMHKISWWLSNTSSSVHLFITAAYWITVYPWRTGEFESLLRFKDQSITVIGIHTHLIPAIYVLMDLTVSSTPRRLMHVYHPMGFVIIYYIFNFTYYICGGKDYLGESALYPALDWTRPSLTIPVMIGSIFVAIPFFHCCVCALYALRIKIWRHTKINRYMREENEEDYKISRNEQNLNV